MSKALTTEQLEAYARARIEDGRRLLRAHRQREKLICSCGGGWPCAQALRGDELVSLFTAAIERATEHSRHATAGGRAAGQTTAPGHVDLGGRRGRGCGLPPLWRHWGLR